MEKKKFKFNYVDVLILILVVGVFAFGYKFINKSVRTNTSAPQVSFTVEVTQVENDYKDRFEIGDEIRDAIKGDILGKVEKIEAKPATELTENRVSGTYVVSELENREDVYITIKGTPASFGADIIMAQQEIKVGNKIYIKKPGCVGRGYIVDVEVEEEHK